MKQRVIALVLVVLLAGCSNGRPMKFTADIKDADGEPLGTITVREEANGVKLTGTLTDLPEGEHAMHIHDKGTCEPPDFHSAKGHFNPGKKKHGLLNPKGAHAGDMPNIKAGKDGKAKVDVLNKEVTLKEGKTSLYTKEGTSLVIHEYEDDGTTQPEGGSGKRIACGELTRDRNPVK